MIGLFEIEGVRENAGFRTISVISPRMRAQRGIALLRNKISRLSGDDNG